MLVQNRTIETTELKKFVQSYLQTAAWVTCDKEENHEFTKEAKVRAEKDCIDFINKVTDFFGERKAVKLLSVGGQSLPYLAAHDFFLTRNGHGTGFWDKPEYYYGQRNADQLSEISKTLGGADLFHVRGKRSKLNFY